MESVIYRTGVGWRIYEACRRASKEYSASLSASLSDINPSIDKFLSNDEYEYRINFRHEEGVDVGKIFDNVYYRIPTVRWVAHLNRTYDDVDTARDGINRMRKRTHNK